MSPLLLGRFLVEDATPDTGSRSVGGDCSERAESREQSAPHEPLDHWVLLHGAKPTPLDAGPRVRDYSSSAAAGRGGAISRPPQTVSTTISFACSKSCGPLASASKIQALRSCSIAP